jgi:hypothetical protein
VFRNLQIQCVLKHLNVLWDMVENGSFYKDDKIHETASKIQCRKFIKLSSSCIGNQHLGSLTPLLNPKKIILKRCRDNDVIPNFFVIPHSLLNARNRIRFRKWSMGLVRSEINHTRFEIDKLSHECLSLHIKLANTMNIDLWDMV